ncbi:hypothetical protein PQF33_12050 [Dactylosporangium aurantiacum]|nr:hypothetical protein [Dactylosporangium aurantiacum]MDG6102836.1 hypothetical protein [Dactylosporangium aurantiacum]
MVNTSCSIGAFTPNPLRADGEVDGEPGDDADQVRWQVVHTERDQQLDRDDVDRQRGEAGETEVREALQRQPAAPTTLPERPQFVQHVVGDQRELDGGDRGRQQGQSQPSVQDHQRCVVDHHTAGSHQRKPAQPAQVGRHGATVPAQEPALHHATVWRRRRPSSSPIRRTPNGTGIVVIRRRTGV